MAVRLVSLVAAALLANVALYCARRSDIRAVTCVGPPQRWQWLTVFRARFASGCVAVRCEA